MYVPASQQPYRPLVPEDEEKARDHCPPHIVRLKPLPSKAGSEGGEFERFGGKKIEKKMSENIRWQKYGTESQRSVADVLDSMLATFTVFHLERSELNTDAPLNAVEVNAMVDPSKTSQEEEERRNGEG